MASINLLVADANMKLSSFSACFLGTIGILIIGVTLCTAGKQNDPPPTTLPFNCKPYYLRTIKFLLKNFNKCSRELKANTTSDKEYEDNIGCAMKCTLRITGYTKNDLVTLESMSNAIAALVPAIFVEPVMKTLIGNCHEKYAVKLNPDEAKCSAYSEYAFCVQSTIADLLDNPAYCIPPEKKKAQK